MKYLDPNIKKAVLPKQRKPRSTSLPRRLTLRRTRSRSGISIDSKYERSKSVDSVKKASTYRSNSLVSILKSPNSPRNSNRNVKFDKINTVEESDTEIKENKKLSKI